MKKLSLIKMAACALVMVLCGNSCNKYPEYKKTKEGAYYKMIESNPEGKQIEMNDVVTVEMDYYLNDSMLLSHTQFNEEMRIQMIESSFDGDMFSVLGTLHVGDSVSIIVRGDSTFLKTFGARELPPFFKEGDNVRFEIRVLNTQTVDEFRTMMEQREEEGFRKADEMLMQYITDNGIDAIELEPGLYYVKEKKGNWKLTPKQGDLAKVHYTGRLLDGTVFDSSIERGEPIEFPLGYGRVIPGWDRGVVNMCKGEKGVLYISPRLAYGAQAVHIIPAFSPLIFEVELVDFGPQPAPQNFPGPQAR